ncbi:MAG TPA: ABC transporter substrate-binding protein [Chloroflexota bacterium]|nr:ABC transporter substrate-binding protein [Chloroflexota bacterium]
MIRHPDDRQWRELLWRRRRTLALGAGGLVTLAVTACGPTSPATPTGDSSKPAAPGGTGGTGTTLQVKSFKEAPQLAQLVKDGKLPPVDQRLPKEPVVVTPWERVGQYGGQWRMATTGRADNALFTRTINYEGLVRWTPDWKGTMADVATKWEVNGDATEFTFTIREGLRWSDGKPVVPDDFVFWLEDIQKDSELTPVFPSWLVTDGKRPTITKVGENAFKYQFAAPNGLMFQQLAQPSRFIAAPSHYLKQWHKKYSTEAGIAAGIGQRKQLIEEEMKRRGLSGDYATFFTIMNDFTFNPDLPVITAWKVTRGVGEGQRVVFDRNPYYWKVDTEGNQLPYIDQVVAEQHEKADTMVLRALNGEIDMQDRHIASNANKAVFVDGQQKGSYKLFETVPSGMNTAILALNLTHKDPEMRKIFQDKRFRIGLSHAINRKEAIDLIYVGQGTPAQPGPLKQSPFYSEKLSTQYLDYDPAKANGLLDEMGLTKKDGRGMRLRFDGKPLFIAFEVVADQQERIDYLQLVKKYWAAVGVDMELKAEDRSIFYTRKQANDHDAGIWGGDGGLEVILEPRWYFPFSDESIYGEAWQLWYRSSGAQGEEPPEAPKKQMELYRRLLATGDETSQTNLMKQIIEIAAEEFYAIGLATSVNGYGIQRNDFFNVPKTMIGSWLYPNPGPLNPAQFFTTRK